LPPGIEARARELLFNKLQEAFAPIGFGPLIERLFRTPTDTLDEAASPARGPAQHPD
jgi:hypothetical protein